MTNEFLLIYQDFFLKKIPFNLFMKQIDEYIDKASIDELDEFYDYTTDNSFLEFDPDMIMLTYLYIWLIPNRFNKSYKISAADNIYLGFIKSIIDNYPNLKDTLPIIIQKDLNSLIINLDNLYLIINYLDVDSVIYLPTIFKGKFYCVNCNDEIEIADLNLELYPYGFYLLEKEA